MLKQSFLVTAPITRLKTDSAKQDHSQPTTWQYLKHLQPAHMLQNSTNYAEENLQLLAMHSQYHD